jgi:hypothetical protein
VSTAIERLNDDCAHAFGDNRVAKCWFTSIIMPTLLAHETMHVDSFHDPHSVLISKAPDLKGT